jgi:hypothetical protein
MVLSPKGQCEEGCRGGSESRVGLTTGVGEDVGKKEPSYTVGGNVD